MRHLFYKNAFKKDFALMEKRGKNMTEMSAVIALLRLDAALPAKYRDHPLSGNRSGFRDCHIQPDWLLIYKKEPSEDGQGILFLEATGTHADLF